jgi:hypothetical protein
MVLFILYAVCVVSVEVCMEQLLVFDELKIIPSYVNYELKIFKIDF